uniref:post-GPI attachment to proteins factor 2-like isoform X2 n=1 Tax=Myxine glutinosa TaxID=7769 RepID=UPI00358EAD50
MMLPLYTQESSGEEQLLRTKLTWLAVATLSCPFGAMVFCITWSLLYDFDRSTATHCGRYVWRVLIGLHAAPRFLLCTAAVRRRKVALHTVSHTNFHKQMESIGHWLGYLEIAALLGITYVSSIENHGVHATFFFLFVFCSLAHMMSVIIVARWVASSDNAATIREWKSRCWKQRFFVVNVASIILAVYVYNRHNNYCEPGAYTIFALVEYLIVLSNMAFHMTSYWEFAGCHLLIISDIGDKSF